MKISWRPIAEVVALVSVVLSLLFVGYEVQLSRQATLSESFGNSSDRIMGFGTLLVENADVWRKGCLGEEMTDSEKIQFVQLVEMYSTRLRMAWLNANLDFITTNSDAYPRAIALSMYRFPAFESVFRENTSMRPNAILGSPGRWAEAVYAQYDEILELGIDRDAGVEHCGR